jgi:hypothetical protein
MRVATEGPQPGTGMLPLVPSVAGKSSLAWQFVSSALANGETVLLTSVPHVVGTSNSPLNGRSDAKR